MPRRRALSVPIALACLVAPAPAAAQTVAEPPEEVVLGAPSPIIDPAAPAETILVAAGTRLYAQPDRRSALVAIVGAEAPRPVLDRAAGWVLLRIDGQGGWAAVADGRAGPEIESPPDADFLAAREKPLTPDPDRLARARTLLGEHVAAEAGAFAVYTDLADRAAIDLVVALAGGLPAVYAERYGLAPAPRDRFAVVVFAAEGPYRAFERQDRELARLEATGHAAGNIAALYALGRERAELGPILLHELTHLLNQSVFRGALPPWLEEGTAEDLSFCRIRPSGRIDPTRLGGVDRRYLELAPDGSRLVVTQRWGAPATLSRLVEALRDDRLMPLPQLLSLSRHEMIRIEGRALRYGQSAFLLRYLLAGAGDGARAGLRQFLRRVSAGGGEPEELVALLGTDWDRLAEGFARWLAARAEGLESPS